MKKNLSLFTISLALAQTLTATPSLNPSPTPSRPVLIEEIREAVKEKVKEKLAEVKKGTALAWTGEIEAINEAQLTLNTRLGSKTVLISEETNLVGAGSKKIAVSDLKIGDLVIAMGYLNEDEILEAKRLVLFSKPKRIIREVAFGLVTDISAEENLLTVKNEKKGQIYTVVVNAKTLITKKGEEGKIEKTKFSSLETGDWLVAIGIPTENEEKLITAKLIHVIPGLTEHKPTATATP
jgi:hypothetical protein